MRYLIAGEDVVCFQLDTSTALFCAAHMQPWANQMTEEPFAKHPAKPIFLQQSGRIYPSVFEALKRKGFDLLT
jgi:hypothetical protein